MTIDQIKEAMQLILDGIRNHEKQHGPDDEFVVMLRNIVQIGVTAGYDGALALESIGRQDFDQARISVEKMREQVSILQDCVQSLERSMVYNQTLQWMAEAEKKGNN